MAESLAGCSERTVREVIRIHNEFGVVTSEMAMGWIQHSGYTLSYDIVPRTTAVYVAVQWPLVSTSRYPQLSNLGASASISRVTWGHTRSLLLFSTEKVWQFFMQTTGTVGRTSMDKIHR
jgi:hypothetical protein